MAHRVGIVGASGYGGAELLRLLESHPAIDVAVVAANRRAGERVGASFPNLVGDRRFDPVDVGQLAALDLVFLCTPHAPALELAAALVAAGTRVVDLSAAYRLDAAGFEATYDEVHPHPGLAPAVYGLTEWFRGEVSGADLVANPGCYPTATLLAMLPLVDLIEPASVVVDAKSGTSGAGATPSDRLHHPNVHGDLVAYGAPTHRHTAEIERILGGAGHATPISFTPHLVPMARGLLATCYATLRAGVGGGEVEQALHDRYAREAFVTVLPARTFPHTKALDGSNGCQLSAFVDDRTRRVVATSAIDNLGKGAAGQAVQNANLMLGLDEGLGLTVIGVYP